MKEKRDQSDQAKLMVKCASCGNMVNKQSDMTTCPYCKSPLK